MRGSRRARGRRRGRPRAADFTKGRWTSRCLASARLFGVFSKGLKKGEKVARGMIQAKKKKKKGKKGDVEESGAGEEMSRRPEFSLAWGMEGWMLGGCYSSSDSLSLFSFASSSLFCCFSTPFLILNFLFPFHPLFLFLLLLPLSLLRHLLFLLFLLLLPPTPIPVSPPTPFAPIYLLGLRLLSFLLLLAWLVQFLLTPAVSTNKYFRYFSF